VIFEILIIFVKIFIFLQQFDAFVSITYEKMKISKKNQFQICGIFVLTLSSKYIKKITQRIILPVLFYLPSKSNSKCLYNFEDRH